MAVHAVVESSGSGSAKVLVSDLSQEIISVYRGWHEFERLGNGPEVIDFDLSGVPGCKRFTSRSKVLSALRTLHGQIDPGLGEGEFLRTRIDGSIFYLLALMDERIPFAEYVERTLGVVPRLFPAEEIEQARREVDAKLAPFSMEMKASDRARFEECFLIRDPEAIARGITADQDYWLARLSAAGIPVPAELNLSVQFARVDAYWSNWISGSLRDGITLSINLHPRKRYYRGSPLSLCLHEICGHAVHMAIWRDRIAAGELDAACGVTTVHSPEVLVSEGLGQTVYRLLGNDDSYSLEFQLSQALQSYSLMVLHNAHLMIYEGVPKGDNLAYLQDHLPFSDTSVLESELRDRETNPLFRTYQLSYAIGERRIRDGLSFRTEAGVRDMFRKLYMRPLTPHQFMQLTSPVGSES